MGNYFLLFITYITVILLFYDFPTQVFFFLILNASQRLYVITSSNAWRKNTIISCKIYFQLYSNSLLIIHPLLKKKKKQYSNFNVLISFRDVGLWRLHLAPGQFVFWETYCPQSVSTKRHHLLCIVIPIHRIYVGFICFVSNRKPLQQETCQWMQEMPPSPALIPATPEPEPLSTLYSMLTSGLG